MTENNDIKPVRPEITSKRGALRNKGGGVLFSSTITIINSLGLVLYFSGFSTLRETNRKLVKIS